jgi:hypothetical protein
MVQDMWLQAARPTASAFTPPTDALVAWWKFDDGTGTTATDSSGNGNTGYLTNVVWATRGGSGCVNFAGGSTNSIGVPNPGAVFDGTNISVTAWVNRTNIGSLYSRVLDRAFNGQFAFYITDSEAPSFKLVLNGGSLDVPTPSPTGGAPSNTWVHIAWVFDYTKTNLLVYTNGSVNISNYNPTLRLPIANSTSAMRIANRVDVGTTRELCGQIDELMVYSRALTAAEVRTIYNGTK